MTFHPYLMFEVGKSREAFTRYQEIFGGALEFVTAADAAATSGEEGMPGVDPDTVLHVVLATDDGALLMASEDPTDTYKKPQGLWTNYAAGDGPEAHRVYDALAEGGESLQPLIETFFSPAFGMCVDRFGIPWMIVADQAEA